MEVTRCGEMEVVAEVVRHFVLGWIFVRRLHPTVAIVDAPKIDGNALADMAEHHFQLRTLIEKAAADKAQRMHRGFRRKAQVGPSNQL